MRITDEKELTDVQEIDGIFFKREDLFMPFENSNINGGKVRQYLELLRTNQSLIESSYNATVGTHTSVSSPQGLLVAKCASKFGFESVSGYSSTNSEESFKKHKLLRLTSEISEVKNISETGYKTAMDKRLKDWQSKRNFFMVNFGINADEVMRPVINQCQNLPNELDYLIVPSGSCVTLAAVAEGVKQFKKKVKHLYGVQIYGYDRTKDVKKLTAAPFEIKPDKTFHEWTKLKNHSYGGVELDAAYEAKAFVWLLNNINYKNNKTLFWLVGNFNEFRF